MHALLSFFQSKSFEKGIVWGLFPLLVILCAWNVRDYGLNWDEVAQNEVGKHTYNYVFKGDQGIRHFHDNDYGVGFELPVYIVQQLYEDSQHRYWVKHLCIHLLFLVSCFYFYRSNRYLFGGSVWGALSVLLLVLSPRIYGDSFHNSKDIVFLSGFILAFYTLLLAFERKETRYFLLHALVTAWLINLRIMGILMVMATLGLLISDTLFYKKYATRQALRWGGYFLLTCAAFLYITWPYLWISPFHNFGQAFVHMKKFRWEGDILVNGEYWRSTALPMHYIPIWVGVTTPVSYLVLIIGGILTAIVVMFRSIRTFLKDEKQQGIFAAFFFGLAPIAAIVLLHSVLYDAWRQVFFVYPFLVILGIFFLKNLLEALRHPILQLGVVGVLGANMAYIGGWMYAHHPHQNVYFNALVPHSPDYLTTHYEMDYWGVCFKQGWEYLAQTHPNPSTPIRVQVNIPPGATNLEILPAQIRKHFQVVPADEEADYYMTNFRYRTTDLEKYPHEVYSISVNHSRILSIFKLR